jgi:hypothetical protein
MTQGAFFDSLFEVVDTVRAGGGHAFLYKYWRLVRRRWTNAVSPIHFG